MDKKDLSDLNREELVDLVYDLMSEEKDGEKGGENGGENKEPAEDNPSNQPTNKPTIESVRNEQKKIRQKKRFFRILKGTLATIVVVEAVATLISVLVMPVIQVSGDSMSPTLNDGDILVLIKTKTLEQGDICCIAWQNKLLIKRVIGLPDDKVDVKEDGTVFVNGVALDEPYVTDKSSGITDIEFPYVVPGDQYFVMGDKRNTSIDSRNSLIGTVERDQIVGKMLFRVWKGSK